MAHHSTLDLSSPDYPSLVRVKKRLEKINLEVVIRGKTESIQPASQGLSADGVTPENTLVGENAGTSETSTGVSIQDVTCHPKVSVSSSLVSFREQECQVSFETLSVPNPYWSSYHTDDVRQYFIRKNPKCRDLLTVEELLTLTVIRGSSSCCAGTLLQLGEKASQRNDSHLKQRKIFVFVYAFYEDKHIQWIKLAVNDYLTRNYDDQKVKFLSEFDLRTSI
jgi:hypothetical protein